MDENSGPDSGLNTHKTGRRIASKDDSTPKPHSPKRATFHPSSLSHSRPRAVTLTLSLAVQPSHSRSSDEVCLKLMCVATLPCSSQPHSSRMVSRTPFTGCMHLHFDIGGEAE